MNKILAAKGIDFADSEYKSFQMSEDYNLTIYLESWDAKKLRLVFTHAIRFSYKLGDGVVNLYEVENNTSFLNEALLQMYIDIPANHSYKLFQLEDLHHFPFIEIVAEKVEVFKEEYTASK